ncbi:MAG: hypothetical protein ACXVDW_15970, partial [Bacteroidia bacterium]
MKPFLLISIFLFLFSSCEEKKSKDSVLKISVKINEKLDLSRIKNLKGQNYSVSIELYNGTDTTIKFLTWICSWQKNWISNNKALFLNDETFCSPNFVHNVIVKSHQKTIFNGTLWVSDSIKNISGLKLGFVLIRVQDVSRPYISNFNNVITNKLKNNADILWSEPFT